MIFWLLLTIPFLLALSFILLPLFQSQREQEKNSSNIDVYKAQLTELARDQKDGLISDQEASSARLEIERRLLRAAALQNMTRDGKDQASSSSLLLIAAISTIVLLLSVGFYLNIGVPGMPDFAYQDQPRAQKQNSIQNAETDQMQAEIKEITAHLTENPNDIKAQRALLRTLGQYNSLMGHKGKAARIFGEWYKRDPDNIDAALIYAESLIIFGNSRVSPAALLVLNKAKKMQPRNPGVRHYLALAAYQSGEVRQALTSWQAIAAESAPTAPWLPQLQNWIRRAEKDLDLPTSSLPPVDKAQREAIEAMSQEEQTAMIRKMVGRLQDRMDKNPDNVEGWLQLTKAYMVIGQKPDALKSLEKALHYAPDDMKPRIKKQLEILSK